VRRGILIINVSSITTVKDAVVKYFADVLPSLRFAVQVVEHLYTVSQKTRHLTLAHNFTKYWPIFKILSLLDLVGNL